MNKRLSFEEMCTELDDLAAVPTDVLAAWVTDRGRCLWESTFGDPPDWTGEDEPDRELATRMCAGCPVRGRDGRRVGRAERGRPAGAARGLVAAASLPAGGHDCRGGAVMSGVELFLGGIAALAVVSVMVKARAGVKRARAAAEIVRVGASPVSLIGHVLITAGLIVGAQWLVITYAASNTTLLLVVLAVPALFAAYPVTKALTVMQVRPTRPGGGRR
jgi:hypothetical protein